VNAFFRCDHCQSFVLFGGVEAQGRRFCGLPCQAAALGDLKFCQRCLGETQPMPREGNEVVHGTGLWLSGGGPACPDCGSRLRTQWVFYALPIRPVQSLRVLPDYRDELVCRVGELDQGHVVRVRVAMGVLVLLCLGAGIAWGPVVGLSLAFFVLLLAGTIMI